MKPGLPKLLFSLFFVCVQFIAFSQVTQLSNNTSLTSGLVVNGKALLISENDSLWTTTALSGGTKKLSSAVSVVDTGGVAIFNNKFYFTGRTSATGVELWATDGTTTALVKDIRSGSGSSTPDNFFVFNNKLYFTAADATRGRELWVTDGTNTGTVLLKDVYAGSKSGLDYTVQFIANNGILYFTAKDSTNGTELWKTNGTAAGTVLVKNITTGTASTSFTQFAILGTEVVFAINAVVGGFDQQMQLWKTNGTSTGTVLLKNFGSFSGFFPPWFFPFKGKLYFVGTNFSVSGSELWVTNGTASGTVLVKDIYAGTNSSMPYLFNAVVINGKFYFTATDGKGAELWSSDGTLNGTTLVKDIFTGTTGSDVLILKNYSFMNGSPDTSLYNGKIFMTARSSGKGRELWITNGTATGTVQVKDTWVGAGSGISDSAFSYFYTTSGLYFSANDSARGVEPWISNGTSTGTKLVADISSAKKNSFPKFLYIYNNQLLLNANNGDNTTGKTDLYKVNALASPLSSIAAAERPALIEDEAPSLKLWPNPAQGQLNIHLGATPNEFTALQILDNSGKVVLRENLNGQNAPTKTIGLSSLPAGVYYVQLFSTKQNSTIPFVKQ